MELLEIMRAANYLDIRGLLDAASKVYQPYESLHFEDFITPGWGGGEGADLPPSFFLFS